MGSTIKTETVDKVDLSTHPFKVYVGGQTYQSKTLIIATGATAKRMGVSGEAELWQKGISACAVCDGALPFFRNKELFVIGGGDSACEEANFLTKFASKVYMVHRRANLRASKIMQERVQKNDKIEILWNRTLRRVTGDKFVSGVVLEDVVSGKEEVREAGGLFYAIGHVPNTAFLDGQLKTDDVGYVLTEPGTTKTSVSGVFAAGDVQDKKFRQAITAAGSGCMALMEAETFLESL